MFWNSLAHLVLRIAKFNCIHQANTHITNIFRVLIVFQQNIAGSRLPSWLLVNLFCFCASCYFFSMLTVSSELLETLCETLLDFLNCIGKTREMSLRYYSLTWLHTLLERILISCTKFSICLSFNSFLQEVSCINRHFLETKFEDLDDLI